MSIGKAKEGVEYDPLVSRSQGTRLKKRGYRVEAEAEIIEGTIKRGKSGRFEVVCDETKGLGGLEIAPTPMQYLSWAILF